ncbi:hypothetical protein HCN44_004679 [Aphidius gifuensis]|uniref:RING-CH-type domain-containing protein n=1 Tax=Aphidius gifuensis TaxID=684658 RepID=A0A835CTB1_APHGI|nr:E3 ubiquitin-protein ligase MARCHF2-like isoform X2 [Aphidius gifuensis]KAF7995207.1 hypothetical protein HCN44_004679 [Aphidius gifuensis]
MSELLEKNVDTSLEEDSRHDDDKNQVEKKSVSIEKDDSNLSTTDICRICHMGNFPVVTVPTSLWEWPKQNVQRNNSQTSTLSSYAYLGPLVSVCKCRGTVALVHSECLERWLTESGNTRCELCGYKYLTKRVPRHGLFRSVWIWFNTVVATRRMMFDIMYLVVTTPIALFAIYVCSLTMRMILNTGFNEIPWMIVVLLPTCSLTLAAYWCWLVTLGRLHGRQWRRFWRNNFVVRLLPDNPSSTNNEEINNHDNSQFVDDFEDIFQIHF